MGTNDMTSVRDDAEYYYTRAADARDLLRHSEDKIVREALATIIQVYETMAKRAEQVKARAAASVSLWQAGTICTGGLAA